MQYKTFVYLLTIFLTSFSALMYELVWSRELSHLFGTTAIAVSTVLTIFMAGLALGGYYGGKLIERSHHKTRLAGYFSFGISFSCLLTLFLLPLVRQLYGILHQIFSSVLIFWLIQFFLTALILIIPTFLIGAIFPMMIKLYHEEKNAKNAIGSSVGISYAADTIGGVMGVTIALFFLIPWLGFLATSLLASIGTIFSGVLLFLLKQTERDIESMQEKTIMPENRSRPLPRNVLILFFLSGCAALMFQVIWVRFVSNIYGTGLYSFGVVLISFLLGLAAGSFWYARIHTKFSNKPMAFVMVEFFIGIFGMALVKAFPFLDRWFLQVFFSVSSYSAFLSLETLLLVGILLVPTFLMGVTLPLLSSIVADHECIGEDAGKLYAINSCGAIFGSFLAGFAIIPLFGLNYGSAIAASIYLFVAIVFFFLYVKKTARINFAGTLLFIGVVGAIFFGSLYDTSYFFGGAYYHGARQTSVSDYFDEKERQTVLFHQNSFYGLVSVVRQGPNFLLKINGKTDASLADQINQAMLAHIPLLLHSRPSEVAVIGLGGGFTAATALKYNPANIDVIEIDPVVAEAVGGVLGPYNNNVLKNKTISLIIADGRNYIASTDKKYDVIISEPPNIWVSGASNLFTKEFYQAAKEHLNEQGILSQWVPRYEMSEKDYQIFIKTILSVFPYAYEFNIGGNKDILGDVVIIAATTPISVQDQSRARLKAIPKEVEDDLLLLIWLDWSKRKTSVNFFSGFYTRSDEDLKKYVEDIDIVNTDNLPLLEFSTSKNRYQKFR